MRISEIDGISHSNLIVKEVAEQSTGRAPRIRKTSYPHRHLVVRFFISSSSTIESSLLSYPRHKV